MIVSVDFYHSASANNNEDKVQHVTLSSQLVSDWESFGRDSLGKIERILKEGNHPIKLVAIYCVAGGWVGEQLDSVGTCCAIKYLFM